MTLSQSEPQKIYIWSTEIKAVYKWDTKVRPTWPDKDYLCFTANTAGSTVKLTKTWSPTSVTLETSTDWRTWTTYTIWDTITLTNVGDKVYWRNTSESDTKFSLSSNAVYKFSMTWSIAWSWDINFLLNKNSTTSLLWNYCFNSLFYGCASLTTAPKLPATTLTSYCYQHMFHDCSSLTTAPSLPATTLMWYCYYSMFQSCTGLTSLPKLPATTLTSYCYYRMFQSCSSIKLSSTQTWEYQTPYRIPTTWTWSTAGSWNTNMFTQTWGTYTSNPSINTTYYTSNTVV